MIFTDQLGREVSIPSTPKKIISIVPSQTELLFDLGLDKEVIGITKFCIHPDSWFRTKTKIGGTKNLNMQLIQELQPDLIIANKEENEKHQVDTLAKEFPVWISDVKKLEDAYTMIEQIGTIVKAKPKAEKLITTIKTNFAELEASTPVHEPKPRVCYLVWKDPYMTIGKDTFIGEMLTLCGFENVYADAKRYPHVSINQLSSAECDFLLLSSEPYPFTEKHISQFQSYLPGTKIELVNGEMFSWYGSRLQLAPAYFGQLRQLVINI